MFPGNIGHMRRIFLLAEKQVTDHDRYRNKNFFVYHNQKKSD